jgi:hypothetical protein
MLILTIVLVEDLVYDLKGNPLQVPSDQNGLFDIWNTADSRVVAVQKLKRKNPSVNTDYLEPVSPNLNFLLQYSLFRPITIYIHAKNSKCSNVSIIH